MSKIIGLSEAGRYAIVQEDEEHGFIADLQKKIRFPSHYLMTLAKHTTWKPAKNDPALLKEIEQFGSGQPIPGGKKLREEILQGMKERAAARAARLKEPLLDSDEMLRIMKEVMDKKRPPATEGIRARTFREKVTEEVAEAKKQGYVIDFPAEWPSFD